MVIDAYKDAMIKCIQMYYPVSKQELGPIVDYSINKRLKDTTVTIQDTYRNKDDRSKDKKISLLKLADWIDKRHPIVTAHGTIFKNHGDCPNPLREVVQEFLDARSEHKKMMFKFPKGSEDFEKYNLLQAL